MTQKLNEKTLQDSRGADRIPKRGDIMVSHAEKGKVIFMLDMVTRQSIVVAKFAIVAATEKLLPYYVTQSNDIAFADDTDIVRFANKMFELSEENM